MRRSGCLFGVAHVAAVSLACALAAPSAHAQAPGQGGATTETIEQLADRAYAAQAAGKFSDAIAIYLKAYDLSKDSLILLNIATIYDRKLNQRQLAEEYYRRYSLASDADPDRVKKVTERLTALKHEEDDERAKAAAAPAPTPQPQLPPPVDQHPLAPPPAGTDGSSPGSGMRTAGIIVGAVGVAGVGASLLLGLAAKNKNDDANAVCNGAGCSSQNGVDLAKTAGNFATGSTIAFIAGLALFGSGIVLYAASPSGASAPPTTGIFLSPRVDLTGAGLALHGAF
jgi:tetratricopeptide (TPR) repeat protein